MAQASPPFIAWRHALTPTVLAAFIAIVVILVATLIMGVRNLQRVRDTGTAVTRTYSIELVLEELLTTLVNAETGARGFIITGVPGYLEPYDRSRDVIAGALVRVRGLASTAEEQRDDIEQLELLSKMKLEELSDAIARRRESGLDAARAEIEASADRRTMDQFRMIVSRMAAREQTELALRSADAGESYRAALVTEFGTSIVALLAVIGLFAGTFRFGAMRLRATQAAEAQQQQLREALTQKDDFVALVAHELRTPTNTVAGWAQMLEKGAVRFEQRDHAVALIARSADALRQLIDDLMDTSQLLSGRMRLTVGPVRVDQVVCDAVDTVRLGADNKGLEITEAIEPGLRPIRGDANRLKQVVWNLLSNAIKFTPPGGHVAVGVTSAEGGVRLEVSDTGEGIDPTFLPHVFERYRQAAVPTSAQRGVGLGLAIVRHLVELHGGRVEAHSAGRGHGATFVIELPFTPVPDGAEAAFRRRASDAAPPPDLMNPA